MAFLMLDCDGYACSGCDQRQVVSQSRDGFRPRELGWAIFSPEVFSAGAFYFTDRGIIGLPKLTACDPCIRHVLTKVHGLPLGEYQKAVNPEYLFRSDQLIDVVGGLCAAAASDGHEVAVVHKGGNEGRWAKIARPGTKTIDLADLGCPRADRIAALHPDWQAAAPPPCEHHEMSTRRGIIHCPTLEVALLSRWVADGHVLNGAAGDPESSRK
jgi:hypothetical protein